MNFEFISVAESHYRAIMDKSALTMKIYMNSSMGAPCSSGGSPPLGVFSAPVSPAERSLDQCRLSLDSRRWHPEGGGDGWW